MFDGGQKFGRWIFELDKISLGWLTIENPLAQGFSNLKMENYTENETQVDQVS